MRYWLLIFGLLLTVPALSGCRIHRSSHESASHPRVGETGEYSTEARASNPELPPLTESSGLSDYLAWAALNNPGLEAAFNLWKAASERKSQAGALPDPNLTYGYFIREVETRVGPQRQKFKLSQKVPWFGKLSLKGEMADKEALARRASYEAKKLNLFLAVKGAYYDLYLLGRSLSIMEENLNLLERLEKVARTRYKVHSASNADLIKVQVEIEALKDRIRSMRDRKAPSVAQLNRAMNRPLDAELPWPVAVPEMVEVPDETVLLEWLRENNPELKQSTLLVEKADLSIKLKEKDFFPDMVLGFEYIDTAHARTSSVRDSGRDPMVATLSFNLPIWQSNRDAAEQEAMWNRISMQMEKEDRENQLATDLKMTLYKFHDGLRRAALYKKTLIPKAEQSLGVAEQGFSTGSADFFGLIDAQRILLELKLSYEKALVDSAISRAQVENIVGLQLDAITMNAR